MALIKCPECNHDLSTEAETCPNCGYPIKKIIDKKVEEKFLANQPEPLDDSWVNIWKNKLKKTKRTYLLIALGLFAVFAICLSIFFAFVDRPIFVLLFIAIFSVFAGIVLLIVPMLMKVATRQMDGYTVVVYVGSSNGLIIENKVVDGFSQNRYLVGNLPNGKPIRARISAWDANVIIEENPK